MWERWAKLSYFIYATAARYVNIKSFNFTLRKKPM
jgi:hypothetical protein